MRNVEDQSMGLPVLWNTNFKLHTMPSRAKPNLSRYFCHYCNRLLISNVTYRGHWKFKLNAQSWKLSMTYDFTYDGALIIWKNDARVSFYPDQLSPPLGKAHFVFESEKSNMHNQLLKQIQEGVKLKTVMTNDRSKPMLEGLRKFRRQLTIEEQIQKAEETSDVEDEIQDEMDDIDAVRDDLQSTKQMLALELRNKEALERDNKRLQVKWKDTF